MLTAHSLCWLCQMPLAIARWGICSRCASALLDSEPLCPQCGLPADEFFADSFTTEADLAQG